MFAHTREGRPPTDWEPLEDHLRLVADGDGVLPGAAGFAAAFRAADWGRLVGLWHDLGKYSDEFQKRLLASTGQIAERAEHVDHATAGAQAAMQRFPAETWQLVAYCITGHHGGLLDCTSEIGLSDLKTRLRKTVPEWRAPAAVVTQPDLPPPKLDYGALPIHHDRAAFAVSVFCRMLFSCLVDADYLATEQWMDDIRSSRRPRESPDLTRLRTLLTQHIAEKTAGVAHSLVNEKRAEVLAACRAAACQPPGLFSLTVPTGGGKTLSSLAFALDHAVTHGLRRVIYAIPFTSIVEQTASVFRDALADAGPDTILEHHSNLDPDSESPSSRLAAENWDAPLIVTTNVQLLESLFSNKTSRCRKLHRIAQSVIILDEAQTLPVEFLRPTIAMLEELCRNFGCTIVLCTATQPAISHRPGEFDIGLRNVREIISDPAPLFDALRRTTVHRVGKLPDEELAPRLAELNQVLCIVNTKSHAAALYSLVRANTSDGVFHLSTRLCAAHRADLLHEIRRRLRAGLPCRVVSTQLIEAGVDIDFPVVYRAVCGLDSLAQAAGRCNREGRRPSGDVFLFEPEKAPPSMFRKQIQAASEVAACHDDLLSLDAIEQYFRLHYWQRKQTATQGVDGWDSQGIMKKFARGTKLPWHFQFQSAAEAYRLIADRETPLIVPYGPLGSEICDELLRADPVTARLLRRAQRYTVGVLDRELTDLRTSCAVAPTSCELWILQDERNYDLARGLVTEDGDGRDPTPLVV